MIAPPLAPTAPPLNTLCWVFDIPEHPPENKSTTKSETTVFRIFSSSIGLDHYNGTAEINYGRATAGKPWSKQSFLYGLLHHTPSAGP
jgi:hypothetical protein